ncbi:MAG: ATP-dependent DNA helicase RecG [Chloroflexi bacterium]|nr:ATP-dependent DNA helicase RecG [Chloroflexota bacterium]
MSDAFDRLKKVLALERRQGFRNRAVIGGLDKFAARWEADVLAEVKTPEQREQVQAIVALLMGYPTLESPVARERVIDDILARAQRVMEAEARPSAEPVPAAAPQPTAPPPPKAPAERPARPPRKRPSEPAAGLDAPVTRLPGVGPRHAQRLAKLGIRTVRDLLWHFPRRYEDYSTLKTIDHLQVGEECTIIGNVWDVQSRRSRSGREIVQAIIGDSTGTIQATWFNPYMIRQLKPGRAIVLSGKIDTYLGRLVLTNPEWEPLDRQFIHTGRLVPIYPMTQGVSARWLRRLIKQTVDAWTPNIEDYLPDGVRERQDLMPLGQALAQIHFPDNWDLLEQARRRLSFDEFFFIQLGMLRQRHRWQHQPGRPLPANAEVMERFREALPFQLTRAQERALREILEDMAQSRPMSRLLQGDVGSGKTAVAAAAMWAAICNGAQAVLMAPTEILAEQHYRGLSRLFERLQHPEGRPVRLALLTGSLPEGEKRQLHEAIAAGEVDIVIGTHALIQETVQFASLGLAVIDEQHRFGVAQRARLRQKGYNPHVLVMSATPIPRTLALTLYGDLDISVLDELPPGRQPIRTRWLRPLERERAYAFIRRQIEAGRQAFIICPLVEESESSDAKAAIEEHRRLQEEVFPDLKLGLLHGRMKGEEKDAVMQAFSRGELDILVATSVVEVGIDVPNATVILIEGAERFGLAQLHQFRGRVGRGEHPSYCILLSDADSGDSEERLKAMEQTQDGFILAQKDLELRGPGDFFGTRQSGLPPLHLAQLGDVRTLEAAREEAKRLFAVDPELSLPEHQLLRAQVAQFWHGHGDLS